MKNFLVDTNVIIDLLARRTPFYKSALDLFKSAWNGECRLFVCSLSYSNISYILRSRLGAEGTRKALRNLSKLTTVLPVTEVTIYRSLDSDFKDFEDSIQYFSAVEHSDIDAIITRDPKGFEYSQIPVISPEDLF